MNEFTELVGIKVPLICGAMYPCSNPELVAAASESGAIGILQPMSLTYVHGHKFQQGLDLVRTLTRKPIGMNLIIERSSEVYMERNRRWLDVALENKVRFFITALGNPKWVVDKVHAAGGIVFHDVTERKWADKALDGGVDGFICVNNRAGGHAGNLSPEQLIDEIGPLGKPLICAGGIGNERAFADALALGYSGAQLGTRFIATQECNAHDDYKSAIVKAKAEDIVLTEKITGVPVAVIKTPYIERLGTRAGFLSKWLLKGRKTKHWMRMFYSLQSLWKLKKASLKGVGYKDYFQAGKSVDEIYDIEPVSDLVQRFAAIIE